MEFEMQNVTNTYPRQRHRPQRTLSMNVRKLQEALTSMLNDRDREDFVNALNNYHKRRNVYDFVQVLQHVIDTPVKRQLIPMLRKVIPAADLSQFDEYTQSLRYNIQPRPGSVVQRAQSMPSRQFRPIPISGGTLSSLHQFGGTIPIQKTPSPRWDAIQPEREVKMIVLKLPRDSDEGWGFSIRGGAEHGIGIYVSLVDQHGISERNGLQIGDQIIMANNVSFERITHDEAAKIIKSSKKLELVIRHVGRVPGSFVAHQTYTWVDPVGRSVSPPPEVDSTGRYELQGRSKSGLMLLKDSDERKVNVVVTDGQSLGLMIRGGCEFGLGIYITGVDPYSVAENAGLKLGDQILDVNGQSFLDISHADAVKVLKSSKHMMMTVKDVGRLPHARTTFDTTEWVNSNQIPQTQATRAKSNTYTNGYSSLDRSAMRARTPESVFSRGAGSQLMLTTMSSQPMSMIEEQARQLLNENERATMNYYVNEYQRGHVSTDALVLALFELLNTHAKFSLLNEVRGLITPRDLDRFDTLVLKREVDALKVRQTEKFQQDQVSLDSSISSHSQYTISSVRESEDGSQTISAPRVPEIIPPNVKLIQDNSMDTLKIAIDQINDDTEGLPDYLNSSDHYPKSQTHLTRKKSPTAPNSQVAVAQVHSDFHSSGSSSPKDFDDGPRSPSDSGVEVNGHYSANGSQYSYHQHSKPQEKQPVIVQHVTNHNKPVRVQNKYSRYSIPDNGYQSDERYEEYHARHHQSKHLTENVHSYMEEPSHKYLPNDRTITMQDGRQSQLSESGYSTNGKKKRVTISPQRPVTINDHLELPPLRRQGSIDSITTESSTQSGGVSPPKHSSDRHNKRYYSDPMHHVPKEQQRTVDQKRKTSEQLYELKKHSPEPPNELTEPEGEIIIVYKHKPTLGIAIEGGANTRMPLPRIINIQPGGSAHESGGLKVGHIILEIDGRSMGGLEHKQAARAIAEAFKNKHTSQMAFVVCEDDEIRL